jgi:hypothetical protein
VPLKQPTHPKKSKKKSAIGFQLVLALKTLLAKKTMALAQGAWSMLEVMASSDHDSEFVHLQSPMSALTDGLRSGLEGSTCLLHDLKQ